MKYVYAHYTKDNNQLFYIGVGKGKSRLNSKASRNKHWHNVVNKHGFYYEVVFESESFLECLKKEIELISLYGRRDLGTGNLVNMTDGGQGCFNMSDESRKKISDGIKGIKRSDEFKNACKERQLGKRLSESTKIKMSESAKNKKVFNIKNLNPFKPLEPEIIDKLNKMYQDGLMVSDICNTLSISKPTLYKYLRNGKNRYSK
jgi:Helix-turn-helix domain of resolvase/NUMOD3 motif